MGKGDGRVAEGKDGVKGAGETHSSLSITTPALGGERKVLDLYGRSELLRSWLKVTEQWWHRAGIQSCSWHLSLLSWHLRRSQSANSRAGRKEDSLRCKPLHPSLTYPFIHSFHE